MDKVIVKTVFAAVFDKKVLDDLVPIFRNNKVSVLGTEGTTKYLKSKGVSAKSVVSGFDFDGRVKTLQKEVFARILADRTNLKHFKELKKLNLVPFDLVIVDLYAPDPKTFPESMDIGGQALIRAAIKNFENVAVAFDVKSIEDLAWELKTNKGSTDLKFRRKQATKASKFIASRCLLESKFF